MGKTLFSSGYEEKSLDEYTPISALAIIALIFGVLSGLAVLQSFFLILPFIAIVLSVIALLRLSLSNRKMLGKTLAYIALFLGIFFSVSRISYGLFRAQQISKNAITMNQKWFKYISEGKLYEAHQLTAPFHKRELPDTDLVQLYSAYPEPDPRISEQDQRERSYKGQFIRFIETEPLATIIQHREKAQFEFIKTLQCNRIDLDNDIVVQVWGMKYPTNGEAATLEFIVESHRQDKDKHFGAHWHIIRVRSESD